MGHRLSKIYTRTGDEGMTGLGEGERVPKDCPRVIAMGDVDELNSLIGVVLAQALPEDVAACLVEVQHKLFDLGGELCLPGYQMVQADDVTVLEQLLDRYNEALPPLKEFILPGGSAAAAHCHVARAVCRRAERAVVALHHQEPLNAPLRQYLNRLSDLLFVFGRVLAREAGGSEVLWRKDRPPLPVAPRSLPTES